MADRSHRLATLCRRLVVLPALTALLSLLTAATAMGAASWLDAPPPAWNTVGAPIASAPTGDLPNAQAMCRVQERTAANPEEQQVAAKGWLLESFWPTLRQGNTAVVLALAMYDGMCRPLSFNAFAFANGTYAGTLSPVLMNSRTDGVFSGTPGFLPDGRISALFLRYAGTDPLCCPSLPSVRVNYKLANGVVLIDTMGTDAAASSLPKTGDPVSLLALGGVGLASLLGGILWRQKRAEPLGLDLG
jgi:LPXTG-motif cell wall-anchored protein